METEALKKSFLFELNKAAYTGCDLMQWVTEPDGSMTITFEKGVWRSSD